MKYRVIVEPWKSAFENHVQKLIKEGWTLQGGCSFSQGVFVQALVWFAEVERVVKEA